MCVIFKRKDNPVKRRVLATLKNHARVHSDLQKKALICANLQLSSWTSTPPAEAQLIQGCLSFLCGASHNPRRT